MEAECFFGTFSGIVPSSADNDLLTFTTETPLKFRSVLGIWYADTISVSF